MRALRQGCGVVGLVLLALLAGCKSEPVGGGGKQSAKEIWMTVCNQCHGIEGRGKVARLGRQVDMTSKAWQEGITDARIEATIRHGKKAKRVMRAYGDQLSDEQIKALVVYIRNDIGGGVVSASKK